MDMIKNEAIFKSNKNEEFKSRFLNGSETHKEHFIAVAKRFFPGERIITWSNDPYREDEKKGIDFRVDKFTVGAKLDSKLWPHMYYSRIGWKYWTCHYIFYGQKYSDFEIHGHAQAIIIRVTSMEKTRAFIEANLHMFKEAPPERVQSRHDQREEAYRIPWNCIPDYSIFFVGEYPNHDYRVARMSRQATEQNTWRQMKPFIDKRLTA
jgi:hypothetical protein